VITAVLNLDSQPGDLLAGHLDPARVGAAGHSAGGFTTAGLLSGTTHDRRLRGCVVISGGLISGPLSGPATPVLFIHGDADRVVKYAKGRAAYDPLPWPKGFLTLVGGNHTGPVSSPAVMATMVDLLRWSLYGDATAKSRLASDATVTGQTRYESAW
jgi:dienelactone hydrolase